MKVTAILLVSLCILFQFVASPAPADVRFHTVQKYYTGGGSQRFGQRWGTGDRPTYEFNGDGVGDLFFVIADTVHIMYGIPDGTFAGPVKTNLRLVLSANIHHSILDLNGDGLDDIVTSGKWGFSAWTYDGSGTFSSHSTSYPFWFAEYMTCLMESDYFVIHPTVSLDCNSDGYDDFMAFPEMVFEEPLCGPCAIYMIEGGSDAVSTIEEYCEFSMDFNHRVGVTTGDFNGDGVADILESWHYGPLSIFEVGSDCQFSVFETGSSYMVRPIRVGNFNGDEFDDFAYSYETGCGFVVLRYGGSTGTTRRSYDWGIFDNCPLCVADFDNDGFDDVAVQRDQGRVDDAYTVFIHYSEGDTFLARCDSMLLYTSNLSEYEGLKFYASDFNFDGYDDLLYFVSPDTIGVLLQLGGPVPTFLQRFAVRFEGLKAARIDWEVSDAAGCESFTVRRSAGDESFTAIVSVTADPSRESYSYLDDISSLSGSDLTYRLEVTREDGSRSILAEQHVNVPKAELTLHQNYPNPFNPGTVLPFTLPERAAVTLDIYDVTGKLVRRLIEGDKIDAGVREVFWNGTNEAGQQVSSGIYYCRLTACKMTVTRKLVLLR